MVQILDQLTEIRVPLAFLVVFLAFVFLAHRENVTTRLERRLTRDECRGKLASPSIAGVATGPAGVEPYRYRSFRDRDGRRSVRKNLAQARYKFAHSEVNGRMASVLLDAVMGQVALLHSAISANTGEVKLIALLFLSALAAPAATVFISSYDITDAAVSGYGVWFHTYNGTITPGGSFVGGGGTGTVATYTGGSGTLNDGVIANSVNNTMLFDETALNPKITLFFDVPSVITSIRIYGGPDFNGIPGCMSGFTVGLGGSSQAIATTEAGDPGVCGQLADDIATLVGTSLEGLTASSVQLSNFTGPLSGGLFSITEIEVTGESATPEPAAMSLLGVGLLGLALLRLHRSH